MKVKMHNSLPSAFSYTDENIFISATCGEKGISFLQGNSELGIRYKEDKSENVETSLSANSINSDATKVTVNGKDYEVIIHSYLLELQFHQH